MSDERNWRCAQCGHEMLFEITHATVDVAIVVGCPGCGCEMDRLDALGELESESRHGIGPVNLRAEMNRRLAGRSGGETTR